MTTYLVGKPECAWSIDAKLTLAHGEAGELDFGQHSMVMRMTDNKDWKIEMRATTINHINKKNRQPLTVTIPIYAT